MKQAWQPVASVARSTTPWSIGASSSDEETSRITLYSVWFSSRSARSCVLPDVAGWALSDTSQSTSYVQGAHASGHHPVHAAIVRDLPVAIYIPLWPLPSTHKT